MSLVGVVRLGFSQAALGQCFSAPRVDVDVRLLTSCLVFNR